MELDNHRLVFKRFNPKRRVRSGISDGFKSTYFFTIKVKRNLLFHLS